MGRVGGTVLVKTINSRVFSQYPGEMRAVDGGVEFYAYDGSSAGLFFSDGTAAGTIELASNVAVDVDNGFTKPFVLADTPNGATLNDFNGDSYSDILWQSASGQASIWDMSGNSLIGGGPVSSNPGPAWKAIGTGDFNGDSNADILWRNASGQASIWDMNGNSLIGGGAVEPKSWAGLESDRNRRFQRRQPFRHPVAEHEHRPGLDLGDEREYFNRRRKGQRPIPGRAGIAIGTGDFNGDGNSDILWQNANTGQVSIWEMDGSALIGGGAVSSNPGPAWKAIGAGDFNDDGKSDILFQDAVTGQASIWEMNGSTLIGGGKVSANPGPTWRAIGTGDFNGDGFADILFKDTSSGKASIWDMNGNTIAGGGPVSPNPGLSWQAIGLT